MDFESKLVNFRLLLSRFHFFFSKNDQYIVLDFYGILGTYAAAVVVTVFVDVSLTAQLGSLQGLILVTILTLGAPEFGFLFLSEENYWLWCGAKKAVDLTNDE